MQSRFRDWGDIRIYLAVMREGSTLAAARELGINQTTVSRRLDVLEHALGITLFEKTTRGARPTQAGQALLGVAEELERAAKAVEAAALAAQSETAGPIRITAIDHLIVGNITQIMSEFIAEHPSITIEFIASERVLDLVKGEADIALRLAPSITDERLIARKLGETSWTYYAAKHYAETHDLPQAFSDDMGDHRIALLSHIASKRKNVLRCATSEDLRTAIRTGQAIGPIPTHDADRDPDLVRCFDPPANAAMNIYLATSPQALKRSEVRLFCDFAAPRLMANLKP